MECEVPPSEELEGEFEIVSRQGLERLGPRAGEGFDDDVLHLRFVVVGHYIVLGEDAACFVDME